MVGVVVTADAEAEELAGGALDLESLDLQGALKEPVAGLEVPVAAPQKMHAADGQEMSGGQPLQKGLELIWRDREGRGETPERKAGMSTATMHFRANNLAAKLGKETTFFAV